MDKTLIKIVCFLFLALVFILLSLLKIRKKSKFRACDGEMLDNQVVFEIYKKLLEKTKPLFIFDEEKPLNKLILGFD